MEFRDGKVARETQYFGDPFEPESSRRRDAVEQSERREARGQAELLVGKTTHVLMPVVVVVWVVLITAVGNLLMPSSPHVALVVVIGMLLAPLVPRPWRRWGLRWGLLVAVAALLQAKVLSWYSFQSRVANFSVDRASVGMRMRDVERLWGKGYRMPFYFVPAVNTRQTAYTSSEQVRGVSGQQLSYCGEAVVCVGDSAERICQATQVCNTSSAIPTADLIVWLLPDGAVEFTMADGRVSEINVSNDDWMQSRTKR
jgi:hypothetical protein